MAKREALLTQTFVELADTLVDNFDVIELLSVLASRTVSLLDAGAAGILLIDQHGILQVMGASTEQARLLELFELQSEEGPCFDCMRTGQEVMNRPLDGGHWPRFSVEAARAGFQSVHAVPLRYRDTAVGALNIFLDDRLVISDDDIVVAKALAHTATISIFQDAAARHARTVTAQLQGALNSRVAIEQAKGMIVERARVDMEEAFARLRRYARGHNLRLSELAASLVDGSASLDAVAGTAQSDS
jgi:GAF domain-containing protein